MTDVLQLPFDQYQRYGLVKALIESVRRPGETLRILDVGGRTALLREFLPDDRVELVDVDPSDAAGLVLGSGDKLPFQDDVFDVVAAFDTLEHVPPALRDAFVAECARVAGRYVILAGPYDHPRVAEAEEHLLEFLKVRLDWEHRYLAEHRENGLPDAGQTVSIFEGAGAEVKTFGHGALDRWLLLMMLELYVEHEGLLHGYAKKIYRFYNEHLFRSDHGGEVYRHAIVAAFGGAPMPHLDDALDPPGSAPREATETLASMGEELLRYDALRDTYQPEMQRLHGVVADVEKDLAEHRAKVATLAADLTEHKATRATLEADLTEHRSSKDTLTADLEQHRVALAAMKADLDTEREGVQAVLADKDERIGALTADLEGHRAALGDLKAARDGELLELEARGKALAELSERVSSQNETLTILNDTLVTRDSDIKKLQQSLSDERERSRVLAEDARRRWNRFGRWATFSKMNEEYLAEPSEKEE